MNFGFTEEQELLRAEVRKFLDQRCPLEEVRRIAASSEGFSRDLWSRISELGWLGLTLPEEHGGAGLGWVDLVVVLEETGRTLLPAPLVSTLLVAEAIRCAGDEVQRARWLPALAAGSSIGAFALLEAADRLDPAGIALRGRRGPDGMRLTGEKLFVPDAPVADLFAVAFRSGPAPEDLSLGVVERSAAGVSVEPLSCVDETRRQGRLVLDDVLLPEAALLGAPGSAWPTLARLIDCGAVAVAAEGVGAAEELLRTTVEHARQRVQFGSPIGRFQGVKHPLAEMYVDIESVKSLVYFAAWTLDRDPDAAPLAAARAKAYASEVFPRIGIDAVQLHGAIGITWECDVHLYLKRARWARPAYGDARYHYDRVAELGDYAWTST